MTKDNQPENKNTELADLHARIRRLEQHVLKHPDAKQFIEHRGVLFKHNTTDGFHSAIYCPRCGFAMGKYNDNMYICTSCNQTFNPEGESLSQIIDGIPEQGEPSNPAGSIYEAG